MLGSAFCDIDAVGGGECGGEFGGVLGDLSDGFGWVMAFGNVADLVDVMAGGFSADLFGLDSGADVAGSDGDFSQAFQLSYVAFEGHYGGSESGLSAGG